ncbi:MAG: hypothetical protein QOI31_1531 [Solirubrobacterales bacterium]|jgi:hypothetical protein|nr:hypothetical protein [Solirubrobacterales bacterium]
MTKGLTLGAVALCVLCAVPSVAGAAAKFESTVAWTDVDFDPAPGGPVLIGTVTSESPKCVKGRKVVITDETSAKVTKTTDADGAFGLTGDEISIELPGYHYDTDLQKKKFGKKGKRKTCLPDSATATFTENGNGIATTISDFAFNDQTNTFSGTLVSADPRCVANRTVGIFHTLDGQEFTPKGETSSDGTGAFSYTHNEEPEAGSWDGFADQTAFTDFEEDGDVLFGLCDYADSNDVEIGPPRRAYGGDPSTRSTDDSLGLSKAG